MATLKRRAGAYGLLATGDDLAGRLLPDPALLPRAALAERQRQRRLLPVRLAWKNYSDALSLYDTQFVRSFIYSLLATLICLLLAYPLAYAIAFKAGKWRHAMLLAVVARSSPRT